MLCLPALAILSLAFLWPLATLFRISLNRTAESGAMEVAVTADSYTRLLGDAFTWQLVWDTAQLAATSAALAVTLALPVALLIRAASPRWRGLLALMAIAPLLISGTARLVGWMAVLGDQGLFNAMLMSLRFTETPLRLINNWTGVRIGLVESLMPYAVLVLLAGLGRLDARLEEAAATLGASRMRTFFRITLPLAAPTILAAWLLDVVLGISAFITPRLMGGGRVFVLATEIYDLALESVDWPAAAALAMLLLSALLLLMLARLAVSWMQGRRA
ncbi:ABC transporter permease [Pseudoroseomonas globiformis]|uniref:ABC transporter permease n=1 Tax=Teichococcus globiformis TaxID=2307229 RepID=A0ABV7G948_9PROT